MADDEYNKKLESLQQYVPFLNKMIDQLKVKDPTKPNREQQLAKITSLYSMITEKKKLKLATLMKCEEVILQLINKAKSKCQTQVLVQEPPLPKPVEPEVKQAEVVVEERATSPSFTPPKKSITFSSFLPVDSRETDVTHNVAQDPQTKAFVTKPSVFDRLGKRIFYQAKPVISFDEALASFKQRLQEQGINLLEEEKSTVEKPPLRITITGTVTTDGNQGEDEIKRDESPSIGGSEEKEVLKTERSISDDLKKERQTSDERDDSKKNSKDRRKCRDTSEETEDSRRGRFKERSKYRKTSEERASSRKSDSYDKRRKFRGTSEDSSGKYKSSKEKEDLRSRRNYKERSGYKSRRNFRDTSDETDDSKTSPDRDRYKANRRFRRSFEEDLKRYKYKEKRRESPDEKEESKSRSYDKYKERRKIREKSEEREDKYAEIRRRKEERRRSVFSRYIYKSSRRETNSKSYTETRHKIQIRTENTSDKYDRRKDYKKYEEKRLEARDRKKSLTPSELAKIKQKYQVRLKSRPLKDSLKHDELPLPTEVDPAVSDVSESSMCDVDTTPVDMVLSPINDDTEICVGNPITTSLPFPFPTALPKSEISAETSNLIPSETNTFILEAATSQFSLLSTDQQTAVQNPHNEIQQLDYYPEGSIPVAVPYIAEAPPVLSPQQEIQRRPRNNNRNEFRVLRELTEQPPNIQQEEKWEEAVVKREETESPAPEPKATEPKPSDAQELPDDEKQMEIINKFLKKLLENETTRAAASVFIENVSNSLDDEKLKKAVNTVMSPKKQPQGRVVNRKLILDDDEEVGSSKELTKKKTKPVIDDGDETEEEVTSTVRDDRKPTASKKKKSELDLLQEDLREMFIHDGILTSTGKRMCSMLKDDTHSDSKPSPSERRTRSLTKQFDMKSSENQQQLRILRSARVVIPRDENVSGMKGTRKARDSDEDEDEDFNLRRRARKPRRIEDSEDERFSPKLSQKTYVDAKKNVDEDSDDEKTKEYTLRQTNKISWSYAEDESDDDKMAKEKTKEDSLRQSDKVSWSYAEENSDDDKESKNQREEYSLRRSSKFLKCYVEIGSDDEIMTKKMVSKGSKKKRKESPNKCDDKNGKDKASPANVESVTQKRNESPSKCDDKKGKDKPSPANAESPRQKSKAEEKPTTPKTIRRKKVSQWALGVIPKFKKKKREDSEVPLKKDKLEKPKKDDAEQPKKSGEKSPKEILELVEPDKNYWAPRAKLSLRCKLCNFKAKGIAQHYRQKHPEYEVLSSRLKPSQAEKAIKASIEQKLEETDEQIVIKSGLRYPFQCCFCETDLTTYPSFFYDHISCHTGEFRHLCSECPYGSSDSKSLRLHYQKVHNKTRDNKPTTSHVKTEMFGYLCLECNYAQMDRKRVEDHVSIYHLGEGKKIRKINLSSIPISKHQSKEPEASKGIDSMRNKRKSEPNQDKSSESIQVEPSVKKKKIEDETNAITLLSLLESFEKNSERVGTDLQKEPNKCGEEATDLMLKMNKNLEEIQNAEERRESLSLKELLNEKHVKQEKQITEINVDRSQKEKYIRKEKKATKTGKKYTSLNLDKSKEKSANPEKALTELSESMKKKWQSLNLDELTIRILKREEASLHTTEDLGKQEPLSENEDMEQDTGLSSETPPKLSDEEEETETIVEQFELSLSPVETAKKIDMSVFTGKTDLEEENEKIDQERLRKMMQLNETIKKKRQSLSIVEQLTNRLLQDKEREVPVLEPRRVSSKETKPTAVRSPKALKKKKVVTPKDHGLIVMSAGFFDVFKKSNELEFVCRVSPCFFTTKYRDTFVTHLNQDHVKINEEYKITECSACQGKILPNSEKGFLKSFFLHMVDNHLDIKDNDQNVLNVKTIKRSAIQNNNEAIEESTIESDDNVMRAGLLDIIKGVNTLKYVCRVVFCTFSTKHRYPFITHWNEEHSSFRVTQCRLCGTEIAASAGNNLLSNFFVHLDEEHLGVKSLKLPESPFSFKISEVTSVEEDVTPAKQQGFVIESVVSLAETEPAKLEEDKPPCVIEEVISLVDDLESPGTSSKDQPSFVVESDIPSAETQDKPSFVIENVVSLAPKAQVWKSESALKAFLRHPKEIYKCPQFYCHFVSDSRYFFDIHVKSHGINDTDLVSCVYCDVKTFMSNVGHHIDTYHQNCLFSCSQCLYRALRKEYVIVHMKLKHKKTSSIISLPKPFKAFKSQEKSHALNETCLPYRCGFKGCQAEFLFQSDYIVHLGYWHGGVMICGYNHQQANCQYRSANPDSMIDHWRTHNCYSFHCLICQVGSMELYTMLEHYSFTHPNRTPMIVDRRKGPANERHGYNGQAFAKIKYITSEVFSSLGIKHFNIVGIDSKRDGIIQIDDDDSVGTKNDISDEMLLNKFGKLCEPEGNELKCPLCIHFKTRKISYFIYHLFLELNCHRFKCNSCEYCCITYGAMAIHCQDEHQLPKISNVTQAPVDKPVQFWIELVLNYQAKVITSKYSFDLGEESQSASRNIRCDICPKWFKDTDTLQQHELYHWAELVYICRTCRFRRPSFNEVLRHLQIAHSTPPNYSIARIPSVAKVISSWKSFTSQPKKESVTVFQQIPKNRSDSQKMLVLPSNAVGQQDGVLYACLHCPKTVRSVEMLQKHNVEAHDGTTDNFECKVLTKSKDENMLLAFVLP